VLQPVGQPLQGWLLLVLLPGPMAVLFELPQQVCAEDCAAAAAMKLLLYRAITLLLLLKM
jgi:hypothetical protein